MGTILLKTMQVEDIHFFCIPSLNYIYKEIEFKAAIVPERKCLQILLIFVFLRFAKRKV
jgi:hypothetical protein